ncbi:IS66 family transposase [Vibrio sp.]|uniref:IS66 family transposase n=1 Tax=Vibrio sp. TaxID=678 RepID=UPI003D0EA6A5
MKAQPNLDELSDEQVRALAAQLLVEVGQQTTLIAQNATLIEQNAKTIRYQQALNDKLTRELALLRRHKFARRSETLNVYQVSLLDDVIDADIGAIEEELARASEQIAGPVQKKRQPKRTPLPPELPRTIIQHEPDNTTCSCGCTLKRIGEDISEKLDYQPGTFTVERHVRGKWACEHCETLIQAPVPAQVIDKGVPTSGLLAHVLVAKYADHLPLYRQEKIFDRAGLAIARSTLADWVGRCGVALQPLVEALRENLLKNTVLHADETPVPMLAPGKKKTHRAYVWAYASTRDAPVQCVIYDFAPTRAGEHARRFLQGWQGKLVCDDFTGYKESFKQGITEIGCMAHARRKFFDLHAADKSTLAEYALHKIGLLYDIERQAKELDPSLRQQMRQEQARPVLDAFHQWLILQRQKVPNGTAIAKAIDYNLKRWQALTRYCDDGHVPIDNNWVENQIRPWALGRSNWLFAGSLRSGQRAAAVMSLIQSARLNGHDPYAYLKDVLERLPTHRASAINELLPHNWTPESKM